MYIFELLVLSRYMPKSGIAGSYGSSIFSFSFFFPAVSWGLQDLIFPIKD